MTGKLRAAFVVRITLREPEADPMTGGPITDETQIDTPPTIEALTIAIADAMADQWNLAAHVTGERVDR